MAPESMRLAGKSALVTGGTSGIGAAIVRLFAAEGARVVFCGRRRELGERLMQEASAKRYDVRFVKADITNENVVTELLDICRRQFGRLNVLVNNAGINRPASLESTQLSDWLEMLATNLTAQFLVLRAAIPLIRESGGGSIINVGSTYGLVGSASAPVYAATKAAMVNLAKSLAVDLARDGIRVNSLCPGGTETEMAKGWFAKQADPASAKALEIAHYPMHRFAEPHEQAQAALFLASDASSYVTGHTLVVDGGFLLG
jgi:NAD(P)-dependent dehydrogenase (short-subunit alcohol dehydrogenase family)